MSRGKGIQVSKMKIIELDAKGWTSVVDIYQALIEAVGGPKNAPMTNPDGLLEYLVWGGMGTLEPPFTIRISNTDHLPSAVDEHIRLIETLVTGAQNGGRDVVLEVPRLWSS